MMTSKTELPPEVLEALDRAEFARAFVAALREHGYTVEPEGFAYREGMLDEKVDSDRLRAENARLREAMKTAIGTLDDPTGGTHVEDMRRARSVLHDALSPAPPENET